MCHECGDEHEDVQFDPGFINELQTLPPDVKEEVIADMQDSLAYIMDKAEAQGFLFEMITSWPRIKVAMYEAAAVMEKDVLDGNHNHNHQE